MTIGTRTFEGELAHYGVKGMKWGVRKGSSTPLRPKSDEAARAQDLKTKAKRKGSQSLTNEEMRFLLDRMNLEERYSKNVKGKNFVNQIVTNPATRLGLQGAQFVFHGDPKVSRGLDFADMLLSGVELAASTKKKK